MVSGDLHRSTVIFNYCNCTRVSSPQRQHRYQYNAGCQYPRDGAKVYDQTRNDQHLQFPALFGVHLITSGSTRSDANRRPFAIHKHHLDNRHEQ